MTKEREALEAAREVLQRVACETDVDKYAPGCWNCLREDHEGHEADCEVTSALALIAAALDAPAESAGEYDAVLDGLISDLADDLAEVSSDGQRERLLGAFRVLLADVLTSVRAARDAEWRDGQVFSSAKEAPDDN